MEPEERPSPADDHPDGVDPALERWVAELRSEEAARSRARVGSLRSRAAEDATVIGVLADLSERRAEVALTTSKGRRHRGRVALVGPDAVVLDGGGVEVVVVRLAAVAAVRPTGGAPVHGEGSVSTTARFGRILGATAAPGAQVRTVIGDEIVAASWVSVSPEVAVLRLDNGELVYVNLDAVDEVSVRRDDR